jgi:hypothetical protein
MALIEAQAFKYAGIIYRAYLRAERGKVVSTKNRSKLEVFLASHKVSTPESDSQK